MSLPNWLDRGVADIFPAGCDQDPFNDFGTRLEDSLKNDRPLRIKLGIDPTSDSIHIGHSVLFRKLRGCSHSIKVIC